MSTAIATKKLEDVRGLINKCQNQIAAALPKHMTPERMARVAFSACQRQPKLLDCTPQSLALSIINAAELGIEPNLIGEAYLVPYGNTCTLIPGYKGLMKLARNSGMVTGFQVGVVREGDTFDYERGSGKFLKHKEKPDNDESPITHFWCGATVDGVFEFEVMTTAQVQKIRKKSKAGNSGPWVDHPEEMGKKTVIRRFCKLLPADSDKLHRAVALDERADAGLPQASDLVDLGAAEEVNPNDTGTGAKVKAKLGISGNDTPPGATYVPAVPDRTDKGFKAWFDGLSEEDSKAYNEAYENARNEGLEVSDSHAAGLAALSN